MDKNWQVNTKSSVSHAPSLVSKEEAERVGSDIFHLPLIHSLYHLPFVEPLNALPLPVLQEQLKLLLLMKFEFLQLALFSLSVQPLLIVTTRVFYFC